MDCTGSWDYKVLDEINVTWSGGYPPAFYLESQASERCPLAMDYFLYPTLETWELGDRNIACLQTGP